MTLRPTHKMDSEGVRANTTTYRLSGPWAAEWQHLGLL